MGAGEGKGRKVGGEGRNIEEKSLDQQGGGNGSPAHIQFCFRALAAPREARAARRGLSRNDNHYF